MKNLLFLSLFMLFGSTNTKQEKPVTDTIKTEAVVVNTPIDTMAYVLPEKTSLDTALQNARELNTMVKKTKLKAIRVKENAERHSAKRQADKAFKSLECLQNIPE